MMLYQPQTDGIAIYTVKIHTEYPDYGRRIAMTVRFHEGMQTIIGLTLIENRVSPLDHNATRL